MIYRDGIIKNIVSCPPLEEDAEIIKDAAGGIYLHTDIIMSHTSATQSNTEEMKKSLRSTAELGLLRSIGDAGVNPTNTTGFTILHRLAQIRTDTYWTEYNTRILDDRFRLVGAETYTTTALAANATYTSPTRDWFANRLSTIGIAVFTDQPSAVDGLRIEASLDGTNWDFRLATTTVEARVGKTLEVTVPCRYTRTRFINGATAQTVFRIGGRYYI